ncbi:MAG: hypothetical protein KDI16_09245 [Halioglobus sp.]|nr:hypothetical protein [Halioglobus sp.]
MIKLAKSGGSTFWVAVMTLGILGCLAGMAYTFFMVQQEAGEEGKYRIAADEMRLLSQRVAAGSRESLQGDPEVFDALGSDLQAFEAQLASLQDAALQEEIERIELHWQAVQKSVRTLIDAGPRIVFIHSVSEELERNIRPIQGEFAAVVDILRDASVSSETIVAAQKTLWLTERIARNIEKILAGGTESQLAADEFRTDAADFTRIVEALENGSELMGVEQLTDPDAIDFVNRAAGLFSVVSASVDKIALGSAELRDAAVARDAIVESNALLAGAISDLVPAIDRLTLTRLYDRGTLMALFGAPGVLAIGLLVVLYRSQRRRVVYTEQGVAAINGALVRIADGDLTVHVPEDNSVTRDIAREINASTGRQRELIRNIRIPFEVSLEEINKIGVTAEGQVEKGKELTRSVIESTTAATEMVRTSEEIKTSTAEAARTSERNRQQVAQGYELTKDMSRASANVRESVQETSKSAKRQGELIQSVTAAAEYIQALNTKISVVAINTRIEAEKAGEHGRPFLGIAEAIGDLLREAEEEGRKIISEVRMLQNLSADNLASMENTVGTVVTILEYIDRLDSSLEEINAGSSAITSIITSVDDAAGQSADTALHMNSSMDEIRQRNLEISGYSKSTQVGVSGLRKSMRDVAENLRQFRIESAGAAQARPPAIDGVSALHSPRKIYGEEEMTALEAAPETRASV